MGIFSRKIETAHFASAPVKAAAGAANIGNFLYYQTGSDEMKALSVPTVSRSRDLIAGLIGSLELKHYQKVWNSIDEEYNEVYLPLDPWMERPDPRVSRSFFFVNIFSDLFFYGVAYAYITKRYAPQGGGSQGFPAAFTWLPAANITSTEQTGIPQFYGPSNELEFNGQPLDVNNVVQFISPIEGILKTGARAINTSIWLDQAADRYAQLETVPGYLQQVDGEDDSDRGGVLHRGCRLLRARRRVFHGLRKSAVVMLLEAGCEVAEVAAITGQSLAMVQHYAADINRRRMASSTLRMAGLWLPTIKSLNSFSAFWKPA